MAYVISLGLLTITAGSLVWEIRRLKRKPEMRTEYTRVLRAAVKPRRLLLGAGGAFTAAAGTLLMWHATPRWTHWSWWWLITDDGQTDQATGNVVAAADDVIGGAIGGFALIGIAALFTLAIPTLALSEERVFRSVWGSVSGGVFTRSMCFGMIHMLVGVPLIVAAVTLTAAGLLYEWEWSRTARHELSKLGPEPPWPGCGAPPSALQEWWDARAQARQSAWFASAGLHAAWNYTCVAMLLTLGAIKILG